MITAALEFFHARKWLAELLLLGVIAGGIAWWHHATYESGIAAQKAADDAATKQLVDEANTKTAELQRRATAAEAAHVQEATDLATYVSANPLHGSLCKRADDRPDHLPDARAIDLIHAGPGPAATDLQPLPAGNTGAVGSGNADIRGLLDVLAQRADGVSAELREFQSR